MFHIQHSQNSKSVTFGGAELTVKYFNRHQSRHKDVMKRNRTTEIIANDGSFVIEIEPGPAGSLWRDFQIYISEKYHSKLTEALSQIAGQAVQLKSIAAKKELNGHGGHYSQSLKSGDKPGFLSGKLTAEQGEHVIAARGLGWNNSKAIEAYAPIVKLSLLR